MECLCGYEYEREEYFKLGDKPFIRITLYIDIPNVEYEYIQYACLKCGTIKLDI